MMPSRKCGSRKRSGSSTVAFPSRCRRTSQRASAQRPTAPPAIVSPTHSPPSCQIRIPEDDAAHADDGQGRADDVDLPRSRCTARRGRARSRQDDHDDHDLEHEPDPPREVGRDEAAEQRPDRRGDRRGGADQRVGLFCAAPSKLPWISDCIAGSSSEAPRPPMIAQKTMIAVRLWARVIARAPIA